MNIGMILDNEFDGDLRVENEMAALVKAGFNVHLLCLNFGKMKQYEVFEGALVTRISASNSRIKKMRALTNTLLNFYPYYWANYIVKFVNKKNIDVLHVHDLFMFSSVFIAQKKIKKKLKMVGDLHENYVEGLKYYKFANTFPGNILISIDKWEKSEIEWINKLDYAITVIEEAVERYKKVGIPEEKFTVVSNYINIDQYTKYKIEQDIVRKHDGKFKLSYIGSFDLHKGLEVVVKGMSLVKKTIPDSMLMLVGTGQNINELKRLVVEYDIENNVSFEGWNHYDRLPSYIIGSDVCLIPHLKTVHTDNTIPHKLFHYMYLKKPVLSSDCNPIVRILSETKSGLIYESTSPKDFAEKLIQIYNDKDAQRSMGENGYYFVNEKYNWDITSRRLIDLYKKIEQENNV